MNKMRYINQYHTPKVGNIYRFVGDSGRTKFMTVTEVGRVEEIRGGAHDGEYWLPVGVTEPRVRVVVVSGRYYGFDTGTYAHESVENLSPNQAWAMMCRIQNEGDPDTRAWIERDGKRFDPPMLEAM